jgi:L-asparaginase
MAKRAPVLFLHGGAGQGGNRTYQAAARSRLRRIAELGGERLLVHSATETVVWVVSQLEDDPLFNAGTGSVLQRDETARMSASVMDGAQARFAAVLNIEAVRNPVQVAQALLRSKDRVLAGAEAKSFARSAGFETWNPVTPDRVKQLQHLAGKSPGTVGAVAMDQAGRLAAATSTGGKPGAMPGRVSDSGTPCGNFAGRAAAVSCTGLGEDIMEEAAAPRIVLRAEQGGTLQASMNSVFKAAAKRNRQFAAIGVDHGGKAAWASTLPQLLGIGIKQGTLFETF